VRTTSFLTAIPLLFLQPVFAQQPADDPRALVERILKAAMEDCDAFDFLQQLTVVAPHRLSGSRGAAEAIDFVRAQLLEHGFTPVVVESLLVPHWERGSVEEAVVLLPGRKESLPLAVCALGGSVGTPQEGVEAELIEVRTFDELHALGEAARGKIVLFNRPMDPTIVSTFEAYGGAVDQRSRGAIEAGRAGAVAVLVRSMTLAQDNVPHTGAMHYADDVPRVPAAAISTVGADLLNRELQQSSGVRVRLRLSCRTLAENWSENVYGQITGSEFPDEIIVVGGHLDAWDKGSGAHDDGAGCAQAYEVLNILRKAGLTPKRTIRAVFFMNEENGNRGGPAYASSPSRRGEHHRAALESDRGGFAPRGFLVEADSTTHEMVRRWKPLFDMLDAGIVRPGGSGVDIAPLVKLGIPGFGLYVDEDRYFDYHHSDNDTIDKVHPRELEMGAVVQALLCYLISEQGIAPPEKSR
jgi:carboxypeptidase Q